MMGRTRARRGNACTKQARSQTQNKPKQHSNQAQAERKICTNHIGTDLDADKRPFWERPHSRTKHLGPDLGSDHRFADHDTNSCPDLLRANCFAHRIAHQLGANAVAHHLAHHL